MSKTILIFCSWLEKDSSIGVFFREQAEIIKPEFNPILVVFKKRNCSLKYPKKYRYFFEISNTLSIEGLSVIEVFYPNFIWLSKIFNDKLRDLSIVFLNKFLVNNQITPLFIHVQSIFDASFFAYKYYKKYNTPYLLTEHNQFILRNVSFKKALLIGKILKSSKKNLVVSSDKIKQFITNGFNYDFKVIGNMISKVFSFKDFYKNKNEIRLITVGAYDILKDQKTLFEALKLVDNRLVDLNLSFVWIGYNGWGVDNTLEVNKLIDSFKFKFIKIETFPVLSRDLISIELNKSDLFIFSSISEGMPVSVLEALACGLPVFTSNCGGVDEIINENNGKIYPIKDSLKLSSYILDYVNGLYNYNSTFISEEIILKYGTKSFKDNLLNIYKTLYDDSSY